MGGSKPGAVTHRESFALGGDYKTVVEADELERRGPPLGGQKGGGKLKGIASAEGMDPEETPSGFENSFDGLDPMPLLGQSIQAFKGLGRRLGREVTFSLEAGDG
ncbi:MAG TPA: hypothetical protein VGG20_10305 [Thermoanaerobaculia bacterium]|jgi:hypothetical protein